jgi:hypothetical protein
MSGPVVAVCALGKRAPDLREELVRADLAHDNQCRGLLHTQRRDLRTRLRLEGEKTA